MTAAAAAVFNAVVERALVDATADVDEDEGEQNHAVCMSVYGVWQYGVWQQWQ